MPLIYESPRIGRNRGKLFRKILLASLFVCGWLPLFAIDRFQAHPLELPQAYRAQYISLATEDERGMVWFVTNSGLHRFDGSEVISFDMQSRPALPGVRIQCLMADRCNRLWGGCGSVLVCFDLNTWTLSTPGFFDADTRVAPARWTSALLESRDGTVYAATTDGRLYRLAGNNFHLEASVPENPERKSGITVLSESPEGRIWMGTSAGQLIRVTPHAKRTEHLLTYAPAEFQKQSISFIEALGADRCVVRAGDAESYVFRAGRQPVRISIPPSLPQQPRSVTPASIGPEVLFLFAHSVQQSVGVYDSSCSDLMRSAGSLSMLNSGSRLLTVASHRKGRLLLLTEQGMVVVSRFASPVDMFLTGIDQMNSVRTIFRDEADRLLVSTYREHLLQLDERTGDRKLRSDRMIEYAMPWTDDSMLVGIASPQWFLMRKNRLVPIFRDPNDFANLKTWNINCFERENDSLVWAGTYSGAYLFNPRSGMKVQAEGEQFLTQNGINCIARAGGRRFFGTHEGVYWCRPEELRFKPLFSGSDSLYNHAIINCIRYYRGELWIGTTGYGILISDTAGHVRKVIGKAQGLADNVVYSLPFWKNIILAGTGNGLSMIRAGGVGISNFVSRDYLPNNEFNRSAWLVVGDTVYMGTVNGLVRINVASLERYSQPVSSLHPSSFSYATGDGIHDDYTIGYAANPRVGIPAGVGSFTIRLSDNAGSEDELFYRLKPDGPLEHLGTQRAVSFVGVGPGSYELRFYRRAAGSNVMEQLLSIPVSVRPLFYQTIWFVLALCLLAGCVMILVVRYRERSIRREQNPRRQIAGDLHDEIGSALTRIYLQTDALINAEERADGEMRSGLQGISGSSQEALASMNDIVWSVDADYDNAADLVSRMKDYLVKIREQLALECVFNVEGNFETLRIGQSVRQNIFLIFREAVNNAVKHAPGQRLDIDLAFDQGMFSMRLRNPLQDAIPAVGSGGQGLRQMQFRATKIRGRIAISNRQGIFLFELALPLR